MYKYKECMVAQTQKQNKMEELLELRRELLNTIDNRQSNKEDLIKVIEEVSSKLLQLYHKSK